MKILFLVIALFFTSGCGLFSDGGGVSGRVGSILGPSPGVGKIQAKQTKADSYLKSISTERGYKSNRKIILMHLASARDLIKQFPDNEDAQDYLKQSEGMLKCIDGAKKDPAFIKNKACNFLKEKT